MKPDALSDAEITKVLEEGELLKQWVTDVQQHALDRALSAETKKWAGFTVAQRTPRRQYANPDAVAEYLIGTLAIEASQVYKTTTKIRPLTEVERVIGREAFAVLEEKALVIKVASGGPSLVRKVPAELPEE